MASEWQNFVVSQSRGEMANCNLLSGDRLAMGRGTSVGVYVRGKLGHPGLNRELLDWERVVFFFTMDQDRRTQPRQSQSPPIHHTLAQTRPVGDFSIPFHDVRHGAVQSPPHRGGKDPLPTQPHSQQALYHPPPQIPFSLHDPASRFAHPTHPTLAPNISWHQNIGQPGYDLPSPGSPGFFQGGFSSPPVSPGSTNSETDEQGDPIAEEKRKRNNAASAQFRNKKKQASLNLERSVSNLSDRAAELEREAADLRMENNWLKEIVILKGNQAALKEADQTKGGSCAYPVAKGSGSSR